MMDTEVNYKTKKAFKEAFATNLRIWLLPDPLNTKFQGSGAVEGPQYPEMHKWYAAIEFNTDVNGRRYVTRIVS